jgi:putative photosynthetic complex assembly protein
VQQEPLGDLRWQRLLRFEDRPGGDIGVIDAATQKEVALLQGEHGFARGALRTLARERLRRNLGPQTPFELSAYVDGKLVLRDPATGDTAVCVRQYGKTYWRVRSTDDRTWTVFEPIVGWDVLHEEDAVATTPGDAAVDPE